MLNWWLPGCILFISLFQIDMYNIFTYILYVFNYKLNELECKSW